MNRLDSKLKLYVKDGVDKKCVRLCNVINTIHGIETKESCEGHGKDCYRIYFSVYNDMFLSALVWSVNIRYCGGLKTKWNIKLISSDTGNGVTYMLESAQFSSKEVYEDVEVICENIEHNIAVIKRNLHYANFEETRNIVLSRV